jgi:hypothetical protein
MKLQLACVLVLVGLAAMITAGAADPEPRKARKSRQTTRKEIQDCGAFDVELHTPEEGPVSVNDPDGDGLGMIDVDVEISPAPDEGELIRAGASGAQNYGIYKLKPKLGEEGRYVGKIKVPCSTAEPWPQFFITIYNGETGCLINKTFQGVCRGHETEFKAAPNGSFGYDVEVEVPYPPGLVNVDSLMGFYVKVKATGPTTVMAVSAEALEGQLTHGSRMLTRIGTSDYFDGHIPGPCAGSAPYPVFSIRATAQFFNKPEFVTDQDDGHEGKCVGGLPMP